jgi:hypothetical protein
MCCGVLLLWLLLWLLLDDSVNPGAVGTACCRTTCTTSTTKVHRTIKQQPQQAARPEPTSRTENDPDVIVSVQVLQVLLATLLLQWVC